MKHLQSINQMTNKVALESMLNKTPGVVRGRDSNVAPDDTEVVATMDTTFKRNGRTWRVSVVAGTFVIGTAVDAQLDNHNAPVRENDIIRVVL